MSMNNSGIVNGNSYVIRVWSMVAIAWLDADSRGQSRSVDYLCTLILDPRIFILLGRGTHLVYGAVGPIGIRVHILLRGSWSQMDSTWIYTPLQLTDLVYLSRMSMPMGFIVNRGVIFGAVIGKIVRSRIPKETGLALSFAAAEAVVLHVHGFGIVLNDGGVSYTHVSRFIALGGRFRLRPTYFDEGIPKRDHGFGTY